MKSPENGKPSGRGNRMNFPVSGSNFVGLPSVPLANQMFPCRSKTKACELSAAFAESGSCSRQLSPCAGLVFPKFAQAWRRRQTKRIRPYRWRRRGGSPVVARRSSFGPDRAVMLHRPTRHVGPRQIVFGHHDLRCFAGGTRQQLQIQRRIIGPSHTPQIFREFILVSMDDGIRSFILGAYPMDNIVCISFMTAPQPAASNRFANKKLTWWHPLQLLMNTDFIRRSFGVSSGKLAAHSVPESCLWKSARAASVRSTCLVPVPASPTSVMARSKPTACAQTLYWPLLMGGKMYRPVWSVYTVVVKSLADASAETPTPLQRLPFRRFYCPRQTRRCRGALRKNILRHTANSKRKHGGNKNGKSFLPGHRRLIGSANDLERLQIRDQIINFFRFSPY